MLASRVSDPRLPPVAENVNSRSSVPPPLSKILFQLYAARTIAWPSRNPAIENSIGIVGTWGATPTSNALRPWLNTLFTTAALAIRGR